MALLGKALFFLVLAGAPDGGGAARTVVEDHGSAMAAAAEGTARAGVKKMKESSGEYCCKRTWVSRDGSKTVDYCRGMCGASEGSGTQMVKQYTITMPEMCGQQVGGRARARPMWRWTVGEC
mmetsp:Transcript_104193/g.311158  ORF Transcript_104193/g.311158 Transcript_104193/m.311158 type:complete len:122 (+) Transcript_104193:49-414(+)